MSNYSLVVSQTDNNDRISGWNTSTREAEWLQILPSNPAEMIGCIGEIGFGSDEYCTGSDELIRYNDQLYIVQNIDLDYLYVANGERKANLHLAASAPELLEALETLMAWSRLPDVVMCNVENLRKAKQAISKAKGE